MRILTIVFLLFAACVTNNDRVQLDRNACPVACDHDLGYVVDGWCEPACGAVERCPEGTAPLSFVDDCLGLDAEQCVCAPLVK